METPEKVYAEGGLKSHRVMGLQEDLVPTPASTPPPNSGKGQSRTQSEEQKPNTSQGGGITGLIKSLVGGTPGVEEPANGTAADGKDVDVRSEAGLKDTAAAGPSTAVDGSSQPAGAEKSPASPYASALESIADEPAAPTGGITGVATSVAGTVTAAAGAAVETIKQAAGYGTAEASETTVGGATGGEPTAVDVSQLPKVAVIEAHSDGTAEVKAVESTIKGDSPGTSAAEGQNTGLEAAQQAPATEERSRLNAKPPVSAFASQSGTETVEPEIRETTDVGAAEQAAERRPEETAPKAVEESEGDKAKPAVCGCCVIS